MEKRYGSYSCGRSASFTMCESASPIDSPSDVLRDKNNNDKDNDNCPFTPLGLHGDAVASADTPTTEKRYGSYSCGLSALFTMCESASPMDSPSDVLRDKNNDNDTCPFTPLGLQGDVVTTADTEVLGCNILNDSHAFSDLEAQMCEEGLMSHRKRKADEMLESSSGRARKLVERVVGLARKHGFDTLAADKLIAIAERFVEKQKEFEDNGKPTHVDIGYHNTQPQCLPSISEGGLLVSGPNNCYGGGLYTANNPHAFRFYGGRGLMCATLKGNTCRVSSRADRGDFDTGIGNQKLWKRYLQYRDPLYNDENVLKTSEQCLPLISYDALPTSKTLLHHSTQLWDCHVELQKLLDDTFNSGVESAPQRITQSQHPEPGQCATFCFDCLIICLCFPCIWWSL